MTFFRPEAKAALWRWREVLFGIALAVLALWWLAGPGGLLGYLAPVLLVGAGALIMVGLQRGRFRSAGGGLGTVQVDEGQVTYFGPLTGGAVALREMSLLTLDGAQRPAHWRLEQQGQPALMIPVDADGADALFDAFASLPGLKTEHMLSQLRAAPATPVVIWQRSAPRLAQMQPLGRA
ncbi:MAG: hypothetical protein ABJX32_09950 [Tateyamaria sp.]|uniref:hypothetical protein n=1 Tax=Tateyamaria sp. TaxID=1929288 RepID=UPI00329AABD0